MEYAFFQEQIGNLIDVFGSKNYPALRVKLFWEVFSHVNKDTFKSAIRKLCIESSRAPLKNEIQEAVSSFSNRFERVTTYCSSCGGNGLVYKMVGLYQNSFRCTCENGKYPSEEIPHISKYKEV